MNSRGITKSAAVAALFSSLLLSGTANAMQPAWQGVSISYGHSWHDRTNGLRISFQYLPTFLNWKAFSIYFDTSAAYWHNEYTNHRNIMVFAIAPVLRFHPYNGKNFVPYAEMSAGGSILTNTRFGKNRLGSIVLFQDLLGFGVNFGNKHQFDLSYHFLHYSNLSFAKYNNGITINSLLTFAYHF